MTTGRINQVAFVADDPSLPVPGLRATTTVAHTSQNTPSSGCRSSYETKPNQLRPPLSTLHSTRVLKIPIPHTTRSRSKGKRPPRARLGQSTKMKLWRWNLCGSDGYGGGLTILVMFLVSICGRMEVFDGSPERLGQL
ncbi:uncharacterized protein HKW66_Vig0249530 [Vigna angularis]|uniref:Uncharacterized protein n=1 Tax=Phaseolus angularis TaxID=3914 RepID=A0A8T0JCM1_PHAAN|nr:uncharacterized protein HKW66_Vig0249530 [Vigna angularis]